MTRAMVRARSVPRIDRARAWSRLSFHDDSAHAARSASGVPEPREPADPDRDARARARAARGRGRLEPARSRRAGVAGGAVAAPGMADPRCDPALEAATP